MMSVPVAIYVFGVWELSPYDDEFHSEVEHIIGTCHTPRAMQMKAKVDF